MCKMPILNKKYDAVIFDLFGTLIDNFGASEAGRYCFNLMADALGMDRETFIFNWTKKSALIQQIYRSG